MSTVIVGERPAELEALIERRRRAGHDRLDEVWEGVLHMSPDPSGAHALVVQQLAELLGPAARAAKLVPAVSTFNLGESAHDYRAPDGGIFRTPPTGPWQPSAALVLEVVSPDDESWKKFDFYAARGVDEVLVVDPQARSVAWFALRGERYEPVAASELIALGAERLAAEIDWPAS